MIRRQATLFDGWYGTIYELGTRAASVAPLAAYAVWGFDLERVFRLMAEGLVCEPGQLVLDVPTGAGLAFSQAGAHTEGRLIAMDLSRGMLRRAAQRRQAAGLEERLELVRADAGRLPLRDGSADRVLCFMSLHCLPPAVQTSALREFKRVLKADGELLGTTLVRDAPAPWLATVAAARLSGFFTPPSTGELRAMALAAGFTTWRQDRQGALVTFGGQ